MKTTMKLADLVESPHYSSIISLTNYFETKENGLRLMHYRWALIENHDGIKNYFVKKMNDFFSSRWTQEQKDELSREYKKHNIKINLDNDNLNYLYNLTIVKKDCIKGKYANNNLSNFLNNLVTKYKVLKKHTDKDGIERYTLINSKRILSMSNRWTIKRWADTWSDEKIFKLWEAGGNIDYQDYMNG